MQWEEKRQASVCFETHQGTLSNMFEHASSWQIVAHYTRPERRIKRIMHTLSNVNGLLCMVMRECKSRSKSVGMAAQILV